jgi:hypothetical protein
MFLFGGVTRNVANLLKFTPRKEKKKSPNFRVNIWQNFTVKKKKPFMWNQKITFVKQASNIKL